MISYRKQSVPDKSTLSNLRDFTSLSHLQVKKENFGATSSAFNSGVPTLNHHNTVKINLEHLIGSTEMQKNSASKAAY